MEIIAGIVNVKVKFHFPGTLTLEDSKIISVSHKKKKWKIYSR